VENYGSVREQSADAGAAPVGSNASMRTRHAYGPARALRYLAAQIVKFAGPVWPLAPVAPVTASTGTPAATTACAACGGDHRCPLDWGELDDARWWVEWRCGDCGARSEVILANGEAAKLDIALDRQMEQIRAAADRLDAERMADEAAAFVTALHRDLIVAADF
jgi:hypothetical protein